MQFGLVPLEYAQGCVLAHTVRCKGGVFKKGRALSAEDCAALARSGIDSVVAAELGVEDVGEDQAAQSLAAALTGEGLRIEAAFTGRVNLSATVHGLFLVARERIDAINALDEAITVATVPAYETVTAGMLAATVKIIPFAVPRNLLDQAVALAGGATPVCRVAAFRRLRMGLIQTRLPGQKAAIFDKTAAVTRARVAALGSDLWCERRSDHETAALAAALREMPADLLLVIGASAVVDRRDVIPTAIEQAGGTVVHFGMPVDPGNLLLLAQLEGRPVVGLPGCARSPRLNGFDWVLRRLCAGLPLDRRDIMGLGVGGLLTEITTRPQPRSGIARPEIAGIVLAAGRATRMGRNKLLLPLEDLPMIAHTVDHVLRTEEITEVIVVLGHDADPVRQALGARPVRMVVNPDFAQGLASSLKCGIAAVSPECQGAVIVLGDMPLVDHTTLDRLTAAFDPARRRAICVPVHEGVRGNPVLWGRQFFAEIGALQGDQGAKALLARHADWVVEVLIPDCAVLTDVDTPESFENLLAQYVPLGKN